ncbi:MAG: hypothetical protein LBK47_10360 [Prevotellaceae bacterium]|nr:hypothetical protein [Prevotellaceae bacterium]
MDVIEHVEDAAALLSPLRALRGFHAETLLVVTVPAYQSLFCSHDEWLGHYRRYTAKMLHRCLGKAGFSPVLSGYFFFVLLVARALQKGKEFFVRPKPDNIVGIGGWRGGKFLSALVKNVLLADYKVSKALRCAGVKLPGLSCYCVAKQSDSKK